MRDFWEKLKRRNVIRETLAYVLVAWVLLQVAGLILPILEAPVWILKTLTIVLICGIPVVMVFSWVYELTDKGFKRTTELEHLETGKKQKNVLNILIGATAIIAIVLFLAVGSRVREMDGPPRYSIAILPLKNISPTDSIQWFIDGLREDIWDRLVQIEGMEPRSLRAAETLHATAVPNSDMAEKLHAKYLLEGSVRQAGDLAILNVSLWNDGQELFWQEEYNEPFENLLFLQRRLARDVVEAMNFTIGPDENRLLETAQTDNLEAYLKVKKGERLVLNNHPGEAVPYFHESLALDPNYADAFGNLAFAYTTMAWHFGETHKEDVRLTRTYADSALALDPKNSPALASLATLYQIVLNNEQKAGEYLMRALETRPNDPILQHEAGASYYFRFSQDVDKSLKHYKRAYELDPIEWKYARELMLIYAELGRHEQAQKVLNESYMNFANDGNPSIVKAYWNAELSMYRDGNRAAQLDFLLDQMESDSLNPYWHTRLAVYFDWYRNDDAKYLRYSKMAYDLDPGRVVHYLNALLENQRFDEASQLLDSEALLNQSEARQIMCYKNYYTLKGEYENLKKLIDSTYLSQDSLNYVWYLAYAGRIRNLSSIGFNSYTQLSHADKTILYATLGNRDSLYYYLKHPLIGSFLKVNSNPALDPYRDEPSYRIFKEKYFLE